MSTNYLSNAVKHGKSRISLRAHVEADAGGSMLRLEVHDDGSGVPQQHRVRLFKPFHQLTSGAGGFGLGLASVKTQSEILGGSCGVGNSPLLGGAWEKKRYAGLGSAHTADDDSE